MMYDVCVAQRTQLCSGFWFWFRFVKQFVAFGFASQTAKEFAHNLLS
jgi:hypothetical protein